MSKKIDGSPRNEEEGSDVRNDVTTFPVTSALSGNVQQDCSAECQDTRVLIAFSDRDCEFDCVDSLAKIDILGANQDQITGARVVNQGFGTVWRPSVASSCSEFHANTPISWVSTPVPTNTPNTPAATGKP